MVGCNHSNKTKINLPEYPVAPSQPVTENYFGTTIRDDFRNLEDLDDSLVQEWFRAEATYGERILMNITGREELIEKMKSYDRRKSHVVTNISVTKDDQYFFLKRKASEDVPRLIYRKTFHSDDELLYDPKDFKSDEGNTYVINYINPNWDGSYVAVALTHSGSEISEMIIIDMKTREPLPMIIDHCWPSEGGGVSWLPDNSGFIYLHFPEIDPTSDQFLKNLKSVLYRIGNEPKDLSIVFSKETSPKLDIKIEDFPIAFLQSQDDKYLYGIVVGATAYGDGYYTKLKDIMAGNPDWKRLHRKEDKVSWGYFHGNDFIFASAKNSSNFRILSTPIGSPDMNNPTILVDEKPDEVIGDFQITSEGIYFTTTKNGVKGNLYCLKNWKQIKIELPALSGRVSIQTKGKQFPELWVSTVGWLEDYTRYKFNGKTGHFVEENLTPKAMYPEFEDFVLKELLVPSHDGMEIPLSVIIHKKNISLKGKHPTLLYGYGNYGISIQPFFSPTWLTWVEEGGVLCIAHVRGGGEKGDAWYQAGTKAEKPNSWKDLISCTEYMIREGYTSKDKTIIYGGSAGGIVIGRAMTESPDLFAVAIADVGIMNALRFEHTPNGPNNTKEFGTSRDSAECMALLEMDAYLHIKSGTPYPATLITTGMNDPRVIAWQPGKFAAKLQTENASDRPIIFFVDYESGHGQDDTKLKDFEQKANIFSFAFWQTGNSKYLFSRNPL